MKKGNEIELETYMKDMYKNVEDYLEKVIELNGVDIKEIFYNSMIRNEKYKDKHFSGFFIINAGNNIYKYILSFYNHLVGNNPPRYSILLCNEETTFEEIIAFIYLAIYCPFQSLFIIVKPDKLNLDIIYEVENILEIISESKIEIKSYILFMFNDIGKSEIGKELLKISKSADSTEDIRTLLLPKKLISNKNIKNKYDTKNIEVVASIRAGLGKTFYIQKKCEKEKRIYVPFQIGGEVKRQTIMRRLKNLKIEKDNLYGLHLDFSDTNQKELFEDFIFSFLIQRVYSNNEDIFCYEDNVKIFIEIPNSFFNFMEKFKLFKEFPLHFIEDLPKFELLEKKNSFQDFEDMEYDKKNKLSLLDINNRIKKLNHNYLYKSDIQMICNYLKNIDKMDKNNLFFYSLNEKGRDYKSSNYCNSEFIDEKECNKLLFKYFKKNNISYHQINIFIKVLAEQLRKFSNNYYLMIEALKASRVPGIIRKDIIQAFIDLTSYFTIGAFDKIISEQNISIKEISNSTDFNENEARELATEKLSQEELVINFNMLNNKGLVCINEDGQSFTIITCAPKNSDIYLKLDELYNSGAKFGDEKNMHINIPDYNSMERNEDFIEIIKKLLDINIDTQTIIKNLGSYVFSADNFFKMVQILIRIKTGIPVLIMGETGCGKTSLINAIAIINNFKIIPFIIHSGINDNEIVKFMVKNNLLETPIDYDIFEDDVDNLYIDNLEDDSNNLNKKKEEKLIIVFFDEFNTCNSLGLLTEIMCNKKCQGVNVRKNVTFAGACNPYRKITNNVSNNTALTKEIGINSSQKLVYSVNPLTHTQLYYIFNFGSLSVENEKKYITVIVEAEINDFVKDKSKLQEIKKLIISAFINAQSFIKEKNGKESVSMRETRKLMTIYKFLIKDFEKKKELSKDYSKKSSEELKGINEFDFSYYLDKDEFLAQKYAISTAIYICYYIRLSNKNDKNEFQRIMNNILDIEFLSYPTQLQNELIENIKLEKGIAPNHSLKLNLFICFIGIMTRIAVFLVGPPGCSKTLCFYLLKKVMKGNHSKSNYWKQYPQLVVTSYQGSLTSTSKGIINTFKDAQQKLKVFIEKNKESNKKIIVCVFIDEIGLCENSPFNPLKALHSFLELDYKNENLDKKVAFVGISNWKLDAAKMNRGIYLNVINPISDMKQMYETALQISNIYDNKLSRDYSELIEKLINAVFSYNHYLKEINAEQINYHGARDFYNLIKILTKKILEKDSKEENGISPAFFSIECNYNGIQRNGITPSDWIKKEFKKLYNISEIEEFGIIECIKNNIIDVDSRYLLLIMKSNLGQYLILQLLKSFEKKYIYYLGSLFDDDIYSETYCARAINKIKYYLEQDIVLILKNLSTTYASLYDLFNQRFTFTKNQKFVEISLGEVSNSTYINNDLKIIVLIREEAVKKQDPPFLNRFEKYLVSFDNFLDSKSKEIANIILEYRKIFKKPKKSIKFNFGNELINYYDEEIKSLISNYKIQNEDNNDLTEETIFDYIFKKIVKTFPQELIAFLNHYKKKNNKSFVEKINYYYSLGIHSNLKAFVKNTSNSLNVVYTFTPIFRSIKFNFNVKNEIFGEIKGEEIKNIYINIIKTEHQFEMEISDFYESNKKLLLIHFEEEDCQNLEFVIIFLERIEKENESNNFIKKMIIILNHLKRKKEEFNKDIFVPNLSSFEQTFIDNLSGKEVLISELMNKNIRELYENTNLINIDKIYKTELYYSFQKIQYLFQDNSIEQNIYIEKIINKILNDPYLMMTIKKKIIEQIESNQTLQEKENEQNNNIYDNIFENNTFEINKDFISMLNTELEQQFIKYLTIFIVNSEKQTILSSLSKDLPICAKKIWEKMLNEFEFIGNVNNNLKSNKIKIWTKLNLPSNNSITQIKKIIESDSNGYIRSYLEKEKAIRDCDFPEDILNEYDDEEEDEDKKRLINEFFLIEENNIDDPKFENVKEEINKFFLPNNLVVNFLKNQIEKDIFIKSFDVKNKEELLDLFFKDYFSHFITSIIQSENPLYVEILKYLIELRFGKKPESNLLSYYSKGILWCQIYKDELVFLLLNFGNINEMFPDFPNLDFLEKVKQKIENKEIDYIISPHNPLHRRLIDRPFLLIFDSFFYNLLDLVNSLETSKIIGVINYLLEIVQNGEIYNSNLKLKSKEFYRFNTVFASIKLFYEKKVYNKENINNYIRYIKKERKMLIENKMDQVSNEIKNQINLLIESLPDCEEKAKTIMKILISKYKEITDINCRGILCDIIFSYNELIKISNEFFIHILDSFDFDPESLEPDSENINNKNPFTKLSEKNILLAKINKNISEILKENLKYIFKFKILQYYERFFTTNDNNNSETNIKNEINIYLGDDSFKYFKYAYYTLMEIKKSNIIDIPNKNIKEIFCIVYCNVFLENFVKYLVSQVTLISERKMEIIHFLKDENSQIKESFKLFILKELKKKYIKERTTFLNVNNWTEQYKLKDLFDDLKFEKSNSGQIQGSLLNLFYGGYNKEEFLEERIKKSTILKEYYDLTEKTFLYNIDLFINDNLSILKKEEGVKLFQKSVQMKAFYDYINTKTKFTNSTKRLIKLFFDFNEYESKFSEIIKNTNFFEIILYAYRFSILCSISNQDSIFSKMINKKFIDVIFDYYIPGADLYCDQWVESFINMKEPISRNHNNGYCDGYYICDCGEYYFQIWCGVPTSISNCAYCHKKIGGIGEKLIKREEDNGKYAITRIYPNKENKKRVEERNDLKSIYGNDFENGYPNMIFEDFEKIMVQKMNLNYTGIVEQSYLFLISHKNVRKLSEISFRILNFIIYSNIYFSYKIGLLTLEEIKLYKLCPIEEKPYSGNYDKNTCFYNIYRAELLTNRNNGIKDENDILKILNIIWVLLEKALKEKNILSIQIFINSIFNDLYNLIINSQDMHTIEQ